MPQFSYDLKNYFSKQIVQVEFDQPYYGELGSDWELLNTMSYRLSLDWENSINIKYLPNKNTSVNTIWGEFATPNRIGLG